MGAGVDLSDRSARCSKRIEAPPKVDSGKNLLWVLAAVVLVACLVLLFCLWWNTSPASTKTLKWAQVPLVRAAVPATQPQSSTLDKWWSKAATVSGIAEAEYSFARSGPSRPEIEKAKCTKLQDFMGVSCLMFALPVLVFLGNYCTGNYATGATAR